MKTYNGTDLLERQIEAERLRERYRTDPQYRLYQVNKSRRRTGSALLSSVREIASKHELAKRQRRNETGRFI